MRPARPAGPARPVQDSSHLLPLVQGTLTSTLRCTLTPYVLFCRSSTLARRPKVPDSGWHWPAVDLPLRYIAGRHQLIMLIYLVAAPAVLSATHYSPYTFLLPSSRGVARSNHKVEPFPSQIARQPVQTTHGHTDTHIQ
jgi:hypothetical protein